MTILEDPPFVFDVKMCGQSGILRMVDIANYSLPYSRPGTTAAERAERCMRLIIDMVEICKAEHLGSLKTTTASQAMSAFRTSHLTHGIMCHNDDELLQLEDAAYYGGRAEAFRLGPVGTRVFHLDVSAMYPSIGAARDCPSVCSGKEINPCLFSALSRCQEELAIAQVFLETDEPAYPYHDPTLRHTIWPVGRFTTTLAGPELVDAIQRLRVIEIHKVAYYRSAPCLQSYCEHILDMRERYATYTDLLPWIKGLGVSLIGKLGQRDRRWVDRKTLLYHEPWDYWVQQIEDDKYQRWRSIAGWTQCEEVGGFAPDAVPAIAAFICSYGRKQLLDIIRMAKWENVYYCDTDAIMTNLEGLDYLYRGGLVGNGEPGRLRVKGWHDNVEILGIKDYIEDGIHTCAGIPAESAGMYNESGLIWRNSRLRSFVRSHSMPQAFRLAVTHERTGEYSHGVRTLGGKVEPIEVIER